MLRTFLRSIFTLTPKLLAMVLLVLPASLHADSIPTTPVTLKQPPHYFRQYNGRNSELLELRSDGTYQILIRRDTGPTQTDYGIWTPTESVHSATSNSLTLRSSRHKENIISRPFTLSGILTENLDHLSSISRTVHNFLTQNTGTTVTTDAFNTYAASHRYGRGTPNLNIDPHVLYSQDSTKEITREEIQRLHSAVEAAQTSTTPVTVTLTTNQCHGVTYLEIPASTHAPWAGRSVNSTPDAARNAITNAYAGRSAIELFVQISETEFRRESTTPHDYLFVPEFTPATTSSTLIRDPQSTDPAVNPVGALEAITSGVQCHLTSTTSQVAGYYSQPGPAMGARLSGKMIYLFPDQTYLYLTWADISPRTIRSRGIWTMENGLVRLVDDGTLQGVQYGALKDSVFLPISFPTRARRTNTTVTVTGILGFPWSYEWLFSRERAHIDTSSLLFYTLEWNHAITPEDSAVLKATLMEKHWRPDYATGKPGAILPKW